MSKNDRTESPFGICATCGDALDNGRGLAEGETSKTPMSDIAYKLAAELGLEVINIPASKEPFDAKDYLGLPEIISTD